MWKKALDWKQLIIVLVFMLLLAACNNQEPIVETPVPEQPEAAATVAEIEPTEEPTAVPEEPTAEPTEEIAEPEPEDVTAVFEIALITEDAPLTFDFESGEQGWIPRGDEGDPVAVTATTDGARSGSQGLIVTDRIEPWQAGGVIVTEVMEPGNTYEISAFVKMVEGSPDSRIVLTMQRIPAGGTEDDSIFEWIAPSEEGGVTDAEWVELKGQYTFSGDVEKLYLYIESTHDGIDDFYIDDVTITQLPGEKGSIAYDFEDGTQGWGPRGDAFVGASSDAANSGSQSLLISDRLENWQGPSINLLNTLQPDTTYQMSAYVRLANGEPDSQVILTMQRTPTGGDTQYEWIAPSEADGVTDAEWVLLEGQYSFSGDVSELQLYLESPDAELVDFYIDDITIVGGNPIELPVQTDLPAIQEALAPYFLVGAALEPTQLESERHATLLSYHFNSLTAENAMKPGSLQPEEGEFNWNGADTLVEFAQENEMAVHGHALVWHQQAAEWMFEDEEGNPLEATEENKALVLQRLEEHIRVVAERYKDDINVWDVVNEVIDPEEEDCMRKSTWFELTGKDYIVTAFETAREVLPDTTLLINDFSTANEIKRQCIVDLVTELQAAGVPVDGIGMQMHVQLQNPPIGQIEQSIMAFAELGEVHITELDMDIYPDTNTSWDVVPEEIFLEQAYRYQDIFELLEAHSNVIGSVTFWGIADDHTWLSTFPTVRNAKPLLFDEGLQAKPAFWGVVDPTQLPVKIQLRESPKGTAVVDGDAEAIWTTQAWNPLYESDTVAVSYQTRWDENNLYLVINMEGTPEDVQIIEVFIDGNNGKTEEYEDDDQHYIFQDGACDTCADGSYAFGEGQLEAAFPLSSEMGVGDEIGFDIRLTLASDPETPISWNDSSNSQDSDTSKYGVLAFADSPRITTAIKGTPVIDGEEDDIWANADEIATEVWILGSEGSTAVVRTMWDNENLYVYADVTDSLLGKSSTNVYEQDSFEIFLDENNGKTTTYEGDDSQYRVNFDNEASFNGNALADKLVSATRITDKGYVVELAIKFDTIVPEVDMIIGFDAQVNNDENDNGIRDTVVEWNDPTHQGYQNTAGWGLLIFAE